MKPFRIIAVILVLLLSSQAVFAGRYYDSATGRFTSVDPKAEKSPDISPYAYCLNNPLKNVDPDGKEPITISTGTLIAIGVVATGAAATFSYQYATNPEFKRANNSFWSSLGDHVVEAVGGTVSEIKTFLSSDEAPANENDNSQEQSNGQESIDSQAKASAQDKQLSKGEIQALKDAGVDVHAEVKGQTKSNGKIDLYKDKDGNIKVKPKGGKGPGEETGYNIKDYLK